MVDKKISITEDSTKTSSIIKENTVCLIISILMFSLFLSFIMDLYSLNPLTAKANIAGIHRIFCSNNKISTNHIPCGSPRIVTQTAMV